MQVSHTRSADRAIILLSVKVPLIAGHDTTDETGA